MREKITIITISFNAERTIERTLDSVLQQQYRPLEYVMVDGASSDGTTNLINKYIPLFQAKGIEINFRSEQDEGISDAFNKGIQRASGSIIGIINADDYLEQNVLENVAEAFTESIDVVCGDCLWVDEDHDLKYIRKSQMKLDKLKYEMVLMHPACFVKKNSYDKFGTFDCKLRYVMDKDLMARFYRNGAVFAYIPCVITVMSAGGVSDTNTKKVFEEGIEVAVRNGVPRWNANLRSMYKILRMKFIVWLKKNRLAGKKYRKQ